MADEYAYDQYRKRWASLVTERSSWMSHWQEISQFLLPRSGRFFVTDRNRGEKRHNNIIDSTATRALRILAAGMMSGMSSPARPWFRLTVLDEDLMEYAPVKLWLDQVAKRMRSIFSRSNTYRALHNAYEELGAFGTAAIVIEDDFENVIHNHPLTAGEYCLATNSKGEPTTLYRQFDMTVGAMVREFGRGACSINVQNLYDRGNLDSWVTITHAIEPRYDRDATKRDSMNMAWKSCYFEQSRDNVDKVLRVGGMRRFKAVCPRWNAVGGDIYGTGPGAETLGDIKQLQQEQMRKGQGIDFMTKPPLQVPSSMKEAGVNALPGGVNYVDTAGTTAGIRTAWEVRLDLNHLLADIQDVRQRINSNFYADLFLMLANLDRTQMTATEVAERHEEKLLMLGPTLERLNNELFDPLIDITFERGVEVGIFPVPPPELSEMDLNVQYISVLAQAQRAVGTNSVNRLLGTVGAIAGLKPEVLDKIDADQVVDVYADLLGVDPSLVVPDDKVEIIRAQRAQQQQAAAAMANAQQAADTAKKLSDAKTGEQNALSDFMRSLSGYST